MILLYPNQRAVTVHKAPADRDHIYTVTNKAAQMEAIAALGHNELKAYLYLASNQEGYKFALSTSDMAETLGSSVDGMRKAINGLIEKGYLVLEKGKEYAFFDYLQKEVDNPEIITQAEEQGEKPKDVHVTKRNCIVYPEEKTGEIVHQEYRENTLDYISQKSFSDDWVNLFGKINVGLYKHTMEQLRKTTEAEPECQVVRRIVEENWEAFEKGMTQNEGYRLHTLLNLVKTHYVRCKSEQEKEQLRQQQVNIKQKGYTVSNEETLMTRSDWMQEDVAEEYPDFLDEWFDICG